MLPTLTGEFRLVADPELRFTPSGIAVANVRLVAQNRKKDDGDKWVDDPDNILWINGTCWRQMAENVAESARKSDLVIVTGKVRTRSFETSDGDKRTVTELNIDEFALSLRFRQILHSDGAGGKATRSDKPDEHDPWATGGVADEPPF